MPDSPTFEALQSILADELGVNEDQIKPETKIADDLGADSLDAVEIAMAAEERWGIEVSEEETDKLQSATVQQALELFQRLFAEQQ